MNAVVRFAGGRTRDLCPRPISRPVIAPSPSLLHRGATPRRKYGCLRTTCPSEERLHWAESRRSTRRRCSGNAEEAVSSTPPPASHTPAQPPSTALLPSEPTGASDAAPLNRTRQFVALVGTVLFLGIVLSVLTVFLVTNMGFKFSVIKVLRKFIKSDVAHQVLAIVCCMIFVRSGLTPLVRVIRDSVGVRTPWESSIENYLLKELYSPLEALLVVAAVAALAESLLPPLISVPRGVIEVVVRAVVSLTFVTATARVVNNIKGRIFREAKWRMELEGKTTDIHRIDAVDKLLTVGIVIVAGIMALQSLGLDVNSVLAIGGVGGLAIGLAGREIFENLFSGFMIMGSRAFDVGDEVVLFRTEEKTVEGIVLDIGWYRTLVRDWEREIHVIPNSLFSRTVVLNVTRKGREWRFFEYIPIRLKDLDKVEAIVSDLRRIIRQDSRVIQKLHKRAFLDEINREYVKLYVSFYVEVPNRDAFMSLRHQFFLDFVDCVLRNGGEIAQKKLIVEYSHDLALVTDQQSALFEDEESLQTMSMVDADAETMIQAPESETLATHNGFTTTDMSNQVDVSSVIRKISPLGNSQPVSSTKRRGDASSGRSA